MPGSAAKIATGVRNSLQAAYTVSEERDSAYRSGSIKGRAVQIAHRVALTVDCTPGHCVYVTARRRRPHMTLYIRLSSSCSCCSYVISLSTVTGVLLTLAAVVNLVIKSVAALNNAATAVDRPYVDYLNLRRIHRYTVV